MAEDTRSGGFRDWLKSRLQDWAMRKVDPLRPEVLAPASGEVLEIGFGTGLNLEHYPEGVSRVVGLDPLAAASFPKLRERIAGVGFAVERHSLRADRGLPFDAGRFDTVVTTWTLCTIPEPGPALREMARVLKPGGRYLFIEHGRAPETSTARWQDRIDPLWSRYLGDGCHMNRPIDRLVEGGGFRLASLDRFRHDGPALLAHMYRGVAEREG